MARLRVTSEDSDFRTIELRLGANQLGRGTHVHFQVIHPTVSANHCEIVLSENTIAVRDLGSTNGTFINGQRIEQGFLRPGDLLRLGDFEMSLESADIEISIPRWNAEGPAPNDTGVPTCVRHPDLPATWQCADCGNIYCESCVRHVSRVGGEALDLCPECGGKCAAFDAPAPGIKGAGRGSFWKGLAARLKHSFHRIL
jgi:hypothetical protein